MLLMTRFLFVISCRFVKEGAFGLFCLFFIVDAAAQNHALLFETQVPVLDQSFEQRQIAYKTGLSEVLVRLSGHQTVLEKPNIKRALQQATSYMVRYTYRVVDEQTYLALIFDEQRLTDLLRDSEAKIWISRRPQLLLWLAFQDSLDTQLLADQDHILIQAIQTQAQRRGLYLDLPVLDLTDRMAVQVSDVWGLFEAPVVEATQRYDAHGAVSMRIRHLSTGYEAQWRIYLGQHMLKGVIEAEQLDDIGQQVVNAMTEAMASRYAVDYSLHSEEEVYVRFYAVHTMDDLVQLEQLLARVNAVESVVMISYQQGTIEFKLSVLGTAARVEQSLGMEAHVQAVFDPWSQEQADMLEYRWLP